MPVAVAAERSFGNLTRQMSRLIDQLHKGYYSFSPGESWTPSVNLYETETAYLVCVDLSGVEKDKIQITVEDHVLKLRGARPVPSNPQGAEGDLSQHHVKVHLLEIDHGNFCREVEVPLDVASDKIAAHYRDGLLWIELPKK